MLAFLAATFFALAFFFASGKRSPRTVSVVSTTPSTAGQMVKTTVFLSSMDLFPLMNETYGKHFTEEPPARSTVAVAGLPRGVDVEIEVTAVY